MFNALECQFSSAKELNLKNIITLESFAYTIITTILIYYTEILKK